MKFYELDYHLGLQRLVVSITHGYGLPSDCPSNEIHIWKLCFLTIGNSSLCRVQIVCLKSIPCLNQWIAILEDFAGWHEKSSTIWDRHCEQKS